MARLQLAKHTWLLLALTITLAKAAETPKQFTIPVRTGLSLIGNPLATNLPVRSLMPNPPEGLDLYFFDRARQSYQVDQFSFGHWTDPDKVFAPGQGAWIRNPGAAFDLVVTGAPNTTPPTPGKDFDLLSASDEQIVINNTIEGEQVFRLMNDGRFTESNYIWDIWDAPPVLKPGEGFFVRWPQVAVLGCGTVYFNNHVPGIVDERMLFAGCDIMSGPEWKAQLFLLDTNHTVQPLGTPLNFLTGTNSGYLDITSGDPIVCVPDVLPGQSATLSVRFWRGATFEEGQTNGIWGSSTWFTLTVGGGLEPPAPLSGIQLTPFGETPTSPSTFTTSENETVEFSVPVMPQPVHWQKLSAEGSWKDLAGETNTTLRLSHVSFADAGQYRAAWFYFCDHASTPATLTVTPAAAPVPGGVDPGFFARFGGVIDYAISSSKVYTIALGPNDELFVGGHFTTVNDILWNGVARLNNDGTLSQSFRPPIFDRALPPFGNHIDTHEIAFETNGDIWIGFGFFSPAYYLPDGTQQLYNPNDFLGPSSPLISLIYPDGRTLVTLKEGTVQYIQRFTADGKPDPTFHRYPSSEMNPQLLARDGKILVMRIDEKGTNSSGAPIAGVKIERHLPDGTLDPSFSPSTAHAVACCAFQPIVERANGQLYVAGNIYFGPDTNKPGLVRLNADGTQDLSFSVSPRLLDAGKHIVADALQLNGKIVVAFATQLLDNLGPHLVAPTLVRLNTDGSVDSTFHSGSGPSEGLDRVDRPQIRAVAIQQDGSIFVAGDFQKYDGVNRDGLVRLFGDPVLPLHLNVSRSDADALNLQLSGTADIAIVETTSNLSSPDWHTLSTATLSETNVVTVSNVAAQKQSFYRARLVR